jgi:hypothetical protein
MLTTRDCYRSVLFQTRRRHLPGRPTSTALQPPLEQASTLPTLDRRIPSRATFYSLGWLRVAPSPQLGSKTGKFWGASIQRNCPVSCPLIMSSTSAADFSGGSPPVASRFAAQLDSPSLPAPLLLPLGERGVRLAQNMRVGPCIPVGIQL